MTSEPVEFWPVDAEPQTVLRRRFAAKAERVFDAWTNAALDWKYGVSFEGRDGASVVEVLATNPVSEDRDAMVSVGAGAGWAEGFAKLDAVLAGASQAREPALRRSKDVRQCDCVRAAQVLSARRCRVEDRP